MLVQPSGEMKTDSLISLNTVSNRMSAPLTGGLASFEYNRRWWRNTMLKYILIRFYMGKQGGDSSGYLRLYFSSHPGPNLCSRLKWVDLCMNAHTPKVILSAYPSGSVSPVLQHIRYLSLGEAINLKDYIVEMNF